MNYNECDIAIIGAGPAGLSAAIYAARSKYKCCVFVGNDSLGQLMTTTAVDNFPGFPDGINGPDLMENMKKQAEKYKAIIKSSHIVNIHVNLSNKTGFVLTDNAQNSLTCDAVVIATGAKARWLGIPSEEAFKGRGVSTCATCDGFFYKDKIVAVVGGGDTAAEEALYLSGIAKHVYVIHRRDKFRASQAMQDRLFEQTKDNVSIIWNHKLIEFIGESNLSSIKIEHTLNGAVSILDVDGVFVAIGHDPQTQLVNNILDLDNEGYVITDNEDVQTKIPGLFVAGDIMDKRYRQAITAAGSGCKAAMSAIKFLDLSNK